MKKVVWGLFFIGVGTLATLQNLGKIHLLRSPFSAAYAVDGNPQTRWSSSFSEPQWLTIDLGAPSAIDDVKLNWEAAYAKEYSIEVSDDNTHWTTVRKVTNGNGGLEDLPVSARGRYVRVTGTRRATPYGFSLWEVEIHGPDGLLSGGKTTSASSLESADYWPTLWPLCLIAAGLPALLVPRDSGNQVVGMALTGVGGFFLLSNLGLTSWDFGHVWPVLLILAGVLLLLRSSGSQRGAEAGTDGETEKTGGAQ